MSPALPARCSVVSGSANKRKLILWCPIPCSGLTPVPSPKHVGFLNCSKREAMCCGPGCENLLSVVVFLLLSFMKSPCSLEGCSEEFLTWSYTPPFKNGLMSVYSILTKAEQEYKFEPRKKQWERSDKFHLGIFLKGRGDRPHSRTGLKASSGSVNQSMENRSQQPNVRFLYPRSAELLGFLEGFGIDPSLLDFIKLTQTDARTK